MSSTTSIRPAKKRYYPLRLRWIRGLIIPLVLLFGWEILSKVGFFPSNLLPAPSTILATITDLTWRGEIFHHIGITLYRVTVGFIVGSTIATILGSLTGYSRLFYDLFDPFYNHCETFLHSLGCRFFLLWMGIYETSKIALIAVGVFFPVYLNLMSGIQNVERKLVEVGKIHRLNDLQLIRRVLLPATLPAYLVGLRSGLGLGWMFVVAAEMMGSSQGLGFLLVDGQTTGRPAIILTSILLFAIFGKLTDVLLATLEKRLLYWRDSYHSLSKEKS